MMGAHTPGPWEIDWPQRLNRVYVRESGKSYTTAIAHVCSRLDRDANARLIAAAPDLVAALERYIAAYPAFRIKPIGAPGSPARIEQENLMALEETARAALAKAKG